ncbi:MAG: hypothetical protein Q4B59_05780 [Lachnospiraceae bacterium]|nr:hypothetical protein [Lachnospiraceae bacterium]
MKRGIRVRRWLSLLVLSLMLSAGAAGSAQAVDYIQKAKSNVLEGGKLQKKAKGLRYVREDGSYVKGAWCQIGKYCYRITAKGYVRTGWFKYKGKYYRATSKGHVLSNRWVKVGKYTYYLRKDGTRVENKWYKISGKYYHFGKNGRLDRSKFIKSGSKQYYVDADGVRVTNCTLRIGGCDYTFSSTGKVTKKVSVQDTIWVGDSRTVGMQQSVGGSRNIYIAKVGEGYRWLNSSAGPLLKQKLGSDPNRQVVFAFGVNDPDNVASYISYYQGLIRKYPKTRFYFMAVNPVDRSRYHGVITNDMIQSFNRKLKAAVGDKYIDTYTYLNQSGFSTADGLHYSAATYQRIYQYVMGEMK